MYYQNELYYLPVHHHTLSNGHRIEDADETNGNKGAVAKLLQDDLNWASKYLRSNSISRASPVSRSSVSPTRGQSVGREINGRHTYGGDGSSYYSSNIVTTPSPVLSRRDRGSRDVIYSYRSGTPEPKRSFSVERRLSYSRPAEHARLPTPTRYFESQNSAVRNHYRNSIDMKPPNPEVSDTRRKLRRLVCQSKRNPHYYS